MILLARSLSRRWTMVTDRAKRVRKVASSIAESPPPTTTMSWSRKKKPSQVAQEDTPWPSSRVSLASPKARHFEPVAKTTVRVRYESSPTRTTLGSVSYTHLRAHETVLDLVCRLLLEKKKKPKQKK